MVLKKHVSSVRACHRFLGSLSTKLVCARSSNRLEESISTQDTSGNSYRNSESEWAYSQKCSEHWTFWNFGDVSHSLKAFVSQTKALVNFLKEGASNTFSGHSWKLLQNFWNQVFALIWDGFRGKVDCYQTNLEFDAIDSKLIIDSYETNGCAAPSALQARF